MWKENRFGWPLRGIVWFTIAIAGSCAVIALLAGYVQKARSLEKVSRSWKLSRWTEHGDYGDHNHLTNAGCFAFSTSMRSVKDYSIFADAAQGAMPARGGARPNRRWRVLARDRQRGKDRRLSFDNIGLRRDHGTIINPIAGKQFMNCLSQA